MDLTRISEILRTLHPRQEKVIRLYFELGCQRPHSASEIADAFQVRKMGGVESCGCFPRNPFRLRAVLDRLMVVVRELAAEWMRPQQIGDIETG